MQILIYCNVMSHLLRSIDLQLDFKYCNSTKVPRIVKDEHYSMWNVARLFIVSEWHGLDWKYTTAYVAPIFWKMYLYYPSIEKL